jgi:DNA-binding XRE family transcriptional regulator
VEDTLKNRLTELNLTKFLHVNGSVNYTKLADKLGVYHQTLYSWRKGIHKPAPFFVAKLGKLLRWSIPKTMEMLGMEKV